jgi:hypothetical protein
MRRLVVLLALEAASGALLARVGRPPLHEPAAVLCWWAAALLTTWLALTTLACVACALGALRAPALRRIVEGTLVFTLTLGAPASHAFAASATPTSTPRGPIAIEVGPDGRIVVVPPTTTAPPTTTTTTTAAKPTTTTTTASPPRARHSARPHRLAPPAPTERSTAAPTRVTVVRGDNLWRIAAVAVAHQLGRAPRDDEIVGFWRRVVDVNRATLRSGDPNLIYPGEQVALPPLV